MLTAEPLVPEPSSFEAEFATENWEDINDQVLSKFRQNRSKQEVIYYVLRFTNLLILFGTRRPATAVQGMYYCTCL